MLREAPLGFPLWLLLQLPGSETLGKRVYRFVARRRYRINALLGSGRAECADDSCEMLR
jgi:predicted DCC family thiol-disulfide oxidoreductase YuxK